MTVEAPVAEEITPERAEQQRFARFALFTELERLSEIAKLTEDDTLIDLTDGYRTAVREVFIPGEAQANVEARKKARAEHVAKNGKPAEEIPAPILERFTTPTGVAAETNGQPVAATVIPTPVTAPVTAASSNGKSEPVAQAPAKVVATRVIAKTPDEYRLAFLKQELGSTSENMDDLLKIFLARGEGNIKKLLKPFRDSQSPSTQKYLLEQLKQRAFELFDSYDPNTHGSFWLRIEPDLGEALRQLLEWREELCDTYGDPCITVAETGYVQTQEKAYPIEPTQQASVLKYAQQDEKLDVQNYDEWLIVAMAKEMGLFEEELKKFNKSHQNPDDQDQFRVYLLRTFANTTRNFHPGRRIGYAQNVKQQLMRKAAEFTPH